MKAKIKDKLPPKKSTLEKIKEHLSSPDSKSYSWVNSGILLLGFTLGIFSIAIILLIGKMDISESQSDAISEAQKCRVDGGRYNDDGSCSLVTEDKGFGCSSNEDCNGWCLAYDEEDIGTHSTGYCSEQYRTQGCFKFIDNGIVNSICMD